MANNSPIRKEKACDLISQAFSHINHKSEPDHPKSNSPHGGDHLVEVHKRLEISDAKEDAPRNHKRDRHGHVIHQPQHPASKPDIKKEVYVQRDQRNEQICRNEEKQWVIYHSVNDPEGKQIVHEMRSSAGEAPDTRQRPHAHPFALQHNFADMPTYHRHGDAQRVEYENNYSEYFFVMLFYKLFHIDSATVLFDRCALFGEPTTKIILLSCERLREDS